MARLSKTHLNKLICILMTTQLQLVMADNAKPLHDTDKDDGVESLLDSVEKSLIDKEQPKITEAKPTKKQSNSPETKSKSTSSNRIEPSTGKALKEIQAKIQEYDHRVEILEADLTRVRANLVDYSMTDNHVSVEVRSPSNAKFIVRDLVAKLDGNTLYNRRDSSGIWTPAQSIPLFNGPLKPGDHRIEVAAVIAPFSSEGLQLPTWQHKTVESTFSVSVPEGKTRKNFVIEITDQGQPSSKAQIKLSEGAQ